MKFIIFTHLNIFAEQSELKTELIFKSDKMRMQKKKESNDALFKLSCLSICAVLLILFRIKLSAGNPVWRQKKENCTIPCCDEGSPSNTVARIFSAKWVPLPLSKIFSAEKLAELWGYYVPPLYRQSATLTPDNFTHKGKQGFLGSKWTNGFHYPLYGKNPPHIIRRASWGNQYKI